MQHLVGARLLGGRRSAAADRVLQQSAPAAAGAVGDEQVLARRHAREQLDPLERAADAEPGPPVGGHACQVLAFERDRAFVGGEDAEQAVEERRLARAVRPDQTDALAFADIEAHPVERGDARELHRDVLRVEQGHCGAPTGAPRDAGTSGGGSPTSVPLRRAFELVEPRLRPRQRLALVVLEDAFGMLGVGDGTDAEEHGREPGRHRVDRPTRVHRRGSRRRTTRRRSPRSPAKTTEVTAHEREHDDGGDDEHGRPERVVEDPRDPVLEHDPLEEDEAGRGLDRAFDRARRRATRR